MSTEIDSVKELQDYVCSCIESLRPNLLDLTRRNPLISTRLSIRSNSIVRVVDELPDVIAYNLCNLQKMRLIPLPSLDSNPQDENSDEFIKALLSARHTDEAYLDAIEKAQDDEIGSIEKAERDLKDRLRIALGMPPRQQKNDFSLIQHAKNNNIIPDYELPQPNANSQELRHIDENIQTLFLPDDLERKLNALATKCSTWEQETGINVLHVAFGFIEWTDPGSDKSYFAPLILLPVKLIKKKSRKGLEFWINSDGEEAEENFVFAEMLKRDFGLTLPKFTQGESVENFFKKVAEIKPDKIKWKVRRQISIGVFPSAKMAMYDDLNATNHDYVGNNVINNLFCGTSSDAASPFADDYETDNPEIEKKVPYLVMDADSSQFSTITDIIDGKNLAVEGPPGTGKSQTIVNTIAAALAKGKKVLFIAEKMAALEVVKSRLEAVGLGEFILPLQANRSTREQVIKSIRARYQMTEPTGAFDYYPKLKKFIQVRKDLSEYISIIATEFGNTGLKIYDILGKNINNQHIIEDIPTKLLNVAIPDIKLYDALKRDSIKSITSLLEKVWCETENAEKYWRGFAASKIDKFSISNILAQAENLANALSSYEESLTSLERISIDKSTSFANVHKLYNLIAEILLISGGINVERIEKIIDLKITDNISEFISNCKAAKNIEFELSSVLNNKINDNLYSNIIELCDLFYKNNFRSIKFKDFEKGIEKRVVALRKKETILNSIESFENYINKKIEINLASLQIAQKLIKSLPTDLFRLRNLNHIDLANSKFIETYCKQGKHLCKRKEEIESIFTIITEPKVGELEKYIAAIKNSGVFSFLSSEYNSAKKFYISVTKRKNFVKDIAVEDLQNYIAFLLEKNKFCESGIAKDIFGIYFEELNTDFDSFLQLDKFYNDLESNLPGIENKILRDVIRSSDYDLIMSLPDIDDEDAYGTNHDLENFINIERKSIESFRIASERLPNLALVFKDLGELELSNLELIRKNIESFITINKNIESDNTAKDLLQEEFKGLDTVYKHLENEVSISKLLLKNPENLQLILTLIKKNELLLAKTLLEVVTTDFYNIQTNVETIQELSGIDFKMTFDAKDIQKHIQYFNAAAKDSTGLNAFAALAAARLDFSDFGLDWALDILLAEKHTLSGLPEIIESLLFHAMAKIIYVDYGETLSRYHSLKLDSLRAELATLDRQIIQLSRKKLSADLCKKAAPPRGITAGKPSELTQMGLLLHEIGKKKRFQSVRSLISRSGDALLELKPCWMMSPLAVAQYLPKRKMSFDLCILDEASQMTPENAIGALARSRQAMIVGDTNQLPPSNFFQKVSDDDNEDEEENTSQESILEMANVKFRPGRRLRWHYRSRHSGLIQFSNHHIYDDSLIVFPSPNESRNDMGVSLVHVEGNYQKGINRDEASTLVEAITEFIRTNPHRSLGVVTLNQKQRDLVQEEIDSLIAKNSMVAQYVDKWLTKNDGLESFFVKNLENVQGDERDVIFISTVYGPEKQGAPVMQRFGPINGVTGRRRLNVLFSRAKEQIVTFSSMTAADIHASEDKNPGAYMLKCWLEYSATGRLHEGKTNLGEPESDFEIFVINQLKAMGCEPVPQVGVVGYRIDIGVKHPSWPHGYIMGVECDGATYHSSRCARDRDRLREEVLNGLGWKLYRIWSTSWFNDPITEGKKLREAIEKRLQELKSTPSPQARQIVEVKPNLLFEEAIDIKVSEGESATYDMTNVVEIGDKVTFRYLDAPHSREISISEGPSDPINGVINAGMPLAQALLDAEVDTEVSVLIGDTIRKAKVEKILKKQSSR